MSAALNHLDTDAVHGHAASSRPLTMRQRLCLEFIVDHLRRFGTPPTLREIGKRMGIRSVNGVNEHLRALERKGCIVRRDSLTRSIQVTVEGYAALDMTPPAFAFDKVEEEKESDARQLLRRALPILLEIVPNSDLVTSIRREIAR